MNKRRWFLHRRIDSLLRGNIRIFAATRVTAPDLFRIQAINQKGVRCKG